VSPTTPGGYPIPKTVVEEAAGPVHQHSAEFEKKHRADAPPDLVLKPQDDEAEGGGADGKAAADTASSATASGTGL
jgi:hypothetical protein